MNFKNLKAQVLAAMLTLPVISFAKPLSKLEEGGNQLEKVVTKFILSIFFIAGIILLGWGLMELYQKKQEGGDKLSSFLKIVSGVALMSITGIINALELKPDKADVEKVTQGL